MLRAKVLVVGPCESGKTALSNFLADATETPGGEYHPTKGVRILEFETNSLTVGGRPTTAEVELWDCSGDRKYETCWPAMSQDTVQSGGVIFVYNADQPKHDRELESWHEYFVERHGLKDSQCLVIAHLKPKSIERDASIPSSSFSKIKCIQSNIDKEGDQLRSDFNDYLSRLLITISDKRDQEELSIMNHR